MLNILIILKLKKSAPVNPKDILFCTLFKKLYLNFFVFSILFDLDNKMATKSTKMFC